MCLFGVLQDETLRVGASRADFDADSIRTALNLRDASFKTGDEAVAATKELLRDMHFGVVEPVRV